MPDSTYRLSRFRSAHLGPIVCSQPAIALFMRTRYLDTKCMEIVEIRTHGKAVSLSAVICTLSGIRIRIFRPAYLPAWVTEVEKSRYQGTTIHSKSPIYNIHNFTFALQITIIQLWASERFCHALASGLLFACLRVTTCPQRANI